MEGDLNQPLKWKKPRRFNPRPRMEGDRDLAFIQDLVIVSIHAPAWRATEGIEATYDASVKFQSTPPHGGRRRRYGAYLYCKFVSIHAPAWRATSRIDAVALSEKFQSTPPHGGRHAIKATFISADKFQSTPPHGGRQKKPCCLFPPSMFQSTPPHGGRP